MNEFREARIKELEEMISHNNFVNDMAWSERAESNIKHRKEIEVLRGFDKIEKDMRKKIKGDEQ